jgi:hypothetical protein
VLPLDDDAAGAVVLKLPPAARAEYLVREAGDGGPAAAAGALGRAGRDGREEARELDRRRP